MADQGQEKTEQPTQHKLEEARKEGNVFQSRDVVTLAVVLGVFLVLRAMLPVISERLSVFLTSILEEIGKTGNNPLTKELAYRFLAAAAVCCLPLLLSAMGIGALAHAVQTRFLFVPKLARPKLSRLNPLNGIKRVFSLRNLMETLKNLLKTAILFIFGYTTIRSNLPMLARLTDMAPMAAASALMSMIFKMILRICMAFAVIAAADFMFQRFQYRKDMMMTKQEVKEEFKMLEGNPEIKNRIRRIQREMSQRRMMAEVPKADVVVRNPTHVAVALKYDPKHASAPYVVAKGLDFVALRIVDTAQEHGVPWIENRELATTPSRAHAIGQPIPQDYFGAVAEILVMIYRQEGREDILTHPE